MKRGARREGGIEKGEREEGEQHACVLCCPLQLKGQCPVVCRPPVCELAFLPLCREGGLTLGGILQFVLYLQTTLLRHFPQQIVNLKQQQGKNRAAEWV